MSRFPDKFVKKGLKQTNILYEGGDKGKFLCSFAVAPYAGAWIETEFIKKLQDIVDSRSLRGSVD